MQQLKPQERRLYLSGVGRKRIYKEGGNQTEDVHTNVIARLTRLNLLNAGKKPSVVWETQASLFSIGFSSIVTRSTDLNCEHTTVSFTNVTVQIFTRARTSSFACAAPRRRHRALRFNRLTRASGDEPRSFPSQKGRVNKSSFKSSLWDAFFFQSKNIQH